jgi:hypothetical protein
MPVGLELEPEPVFHKYWSQDGAVAVTIPLPNCLLRVPQESD